MDQRALANGIREQMGWCQRLGSPLYYDLLSRVADAIDVTGACWKALGPYVGEDPRSLLPLRFLAAIHRQVLEGRMPALAEAYAKKDSAGAWTALYRAWSSPERCRESGHSTAQPLRSLRVQDVT